MSIVREPSIPRVGGPCWGDMDDDASLPELISQSSPSAKTTTLPSILSEEITPDNPHSTKHMLNSSPPARLQLDFRAIVSSWNAQPSACLSPSVITSTSTPTSIPSTSTSTSSVSSVSRTENMSPKDPICKVLNFEPQPLPTIQEFDAELDSSRDGLPLLFKSTGLSTTTAQATPTLTRTTTPVSVWGNLPISAPRVPLSSIQQQQAAITPPPPAAPATRKRRHTPLKAVITPSKQILKMSTDKKQDTVMTSTSSSHPAGWTPDRSKQLIHTISGSPRADSVDVQTPINGKKQRRSAPTPISISPITVPLTPTQDVISLPSTHMSTSTSPSASVATSPLSIISSPTPTTDIDPLTLTLSTSTTTTKGQPPRTLTRKERLAQRQKQIDLGKKTQGYQHYIQTIPKRERTSSHPKTPNIHKVCSKRSWDGQVRQWRRLLHTFDPQPHANGEQEQDQLNTSYEHDVLNTSCESDGVEVNVDEKENDGDAANRGDAEEEWTLVEKGEDVHM